jgi:hypothetical protein
MVKSTKQNKDNTKPTLFIRRRRRKAPRKLPLASKRVGLPTFQIKAQLHGTKSSHETSSDDFPEMETFEEEIPCDSLFAFHSLLENSQGLHVPMGNNKHFQVLLATQIYQRFEERSVSTICSEILLLIRNNQLLRLWCQDEGETALMLTKDYVIAVLSAATDEASTKVLEWFVDCLKHWTETIIKEESMQDSWKSDIVLSANKNLSFHDVVQYLLNFGFLLPAISSSANATRRYYLWHPQWGLVLKRWNKARRQLLAYIARSKRGEVSERNLLNQNRHACVSTRFLLDELSYRGKIKIIQRPFGRFAQCGEV